MMMNIILLQLERDPTFSPLFTLVTMATLDSPHSTLTYPQTPQKVSVWGSLYLSSSRVLRSCYAAPVRNGGRGEEVGEEGGGVVSCNYSVHL